MSTTAVRQPSRTSAASPEPALDVAVRRRRRAVRPALVLAGLAILLVAALAIRILLGTYTVTIPDFLAILGGDTVPNAPGARFIVMQDKLPRAVIGALAGLCLGCAGAIFQLILRNPLASPDIIGVNACASLGGIVALAFFGASTAGMALGGLIGAVACVLVVFGLSVSRGAMVGNRFILMGLGVAVLAVALTNYLLARINLYKAADAAIWITGSLGSATWQRISMLGVVMIVVLPVVVIFSKNLHALQVGDELAAGLGVPVAATRWLYIGAAVVMVAAAVAATGPITFVAFISGPIARKLLGGRHGVAASAMIGAIIVVLADFAAANLIPGGRLPVGVVTGIVGAPVLLWLVAAAQKERS